MNTLIGTIRHNIENTTERITLAAQSVGRKSSDITLVIVTKTQPLEIVQAVVEAGGDNLGENYPEEAVPKILALNRLANVHWHMIGHVQSRKSMLVAKHFSLVHSLDSVKLAERLNRQVKELGIRQRLPVLLEMNMADEASKYGWNAGIVSTWPSLYPDFEIISSLDHLLICGLMTMPPLNPDPEFSRPYFVKLCRLRDDLVKRYPFIQLDHLSMGTSIDYMVAVQEGATFVRIGQAILGTRQPKNKLV